MKVAIITVSNKLQVFEKVSKITQGNENEIFLFDEGNCDLAEFSQYDIISIVVQP